ncbi:cation:proton antiporter [Methanococcus maripaludis]|uniref:Na+/H+ exchanger n=1 Tax=Methanococcus maripaludis (strain DSM 14266 / JCM 13030 / NBRC 101832 / S2 / LL) TaxID=267377 RepID=Q6LYX1_METMP|nr:cation:proton antiporter [Methanococcus maripaludis]CAF30420.1 Na+/H+ exchanger [Methanococcus maripaludis S2]
MDISWVLFTVGVCLIFGKIGNEIMWRFGFPSVFGEILIGIIFGNLLFFGIVDSSHLTLHENDIFDFLSTVGIMFLLFISGLEIDIHRLKKTENISIVAAVLGAVFPLIFGYISLSYFGYTAKESIVGGVILTATSIGITARLLMDLKVLKTDVGAAAISASILDDFLGLILLILAVGSGSLLGLISEITVFFIITGYFGWKLIKKYLIFAEKFHIEKTVLSFTIALMFLFSFLSESWFEVAIEGAFMAGLILSKTSEGKTLAKEIKSIGNSFLIPLFFIYTGARLNLTAFLNHEALILATIFIIVGVFTKFVGWGLGAKIMGKWDLKKSIQLASASVPRAEIALINLMIAVSAGVILEENISKFIAATLIFVTFSIVITPPLLKKVFE